MRKTLYLLILALSFACKSHTGIITKQYYEPPQTVQYMRKNGKESLPQHDDADFCLEVAPVNQTYWKMTRQAVPVTKLYMDYNRWKQSHIGDTISYRPADQKDKPRQTPWKQ